MGLYVRDEQVRKLAAKLAVAEHVTITEAVRRALQEKLARHRDEHEARWGQLREIQGQIAAMPELRPGFTDADLYDENGLPIL